MSALWFGNKSYIEDRVTILEELHDGIGLSRIDQKHGVDGPALLTKIQALSDDEIEVIWDHNYGFWQDPEHGVVPGRPS